ncbi:DUF1801 domain-containing protein [Pedobacter sp. ASV28]|uniref:DUF1801 domain-containing protein n=1 Tax=Pedobacter sp. ASV28 TaxID=2795123 RepID=UPI0018EBB1DE
MAKSTDVNDPESVSDFIGKLDPTFATFLQSIRQFILSIDPVIGEQIKWNSPSFFYNGEMKPFDPKTYKRDMIVFNIRKNEALLVFPTGDIINDQHALLEGNYTDGRKLVRFKDGEDFEKKKHALRLAIKDWLEKVEK